MACGLLLTQDGKRIDKSNRSGGSSLSLKQYSFGVAFYTEVGLSVFYWDTNNVTNDYERDMHSYFYNKQPYAACTFNQAKLSLKQSQVQAKQGQRRRRNQNSILHGPVKTMAIDVWKNMVDRSVVKC